MYYRVLILYKLTCLFIYLMSSIDIASKWFIACLKDILIFFFNVSVNNYNSSCYASFKNMIRMK